MKYIYNQLSFVLDDSIYTVYLTRECFDSDKQILLSAAKNIDNMLSLNVQALDSINLEHNISSDDFIKYLEAKYQLSLAISFCTDFTTTLPLSIVKEKYIPPAKDEECNTEIFIQK